MRAYLAAAALQGMVSPLPYWKKVRRTGPLCYWPFWDAVGSLVVNELMRKVSTPAEFLLNGDFESGSFTNWISDASDGTIEVEGAVVHGGSQAIKITAGATMGTYVAQKQIPVTPGEGYTFRVWTRGDGSHQGRIIIKNAISGANIVSQGTGITAAEYAQFSKAFTIPAGCNKISIHLYNAIDGAGVVTYYDDASLTGPALAIPGRAYIQNGGVLGQEGGREGATCLFLDGTNDLVSLAGPAIMDAFDEEEGGMLVSAKVSDAADWLDSTVRYLFRFKTTDGVDAYTFAKHSVDNTLVWQANADGINTTITLAGQDTTDWFSMGLTWSKSADQVKAYFNGVQTGDTEHWNTFDGTLALLKCCIGAEDMNTVTEAWKGWVRDAILWAGKAPSALEIARLA